MQIRGAALRFSTDLHNYTYKSIPSGNRLVYKKSKKHKKPEKNVVSTQHLEHQSGLYTRFSRMNGHFRNVM